jgi:hypothetical protein
MVLPTNGRPEDSEHQQYDPGQGHPAESGVDKAFAPYPTEITGERSAPAALPRHPPHGEQKSEIQTGFSDFGKIEVPGRLRDKRVEVCPIPHREVQDAADQTNREAGDEPTEIGVQRYEEKIPPAYLAAACGYLSDRCLYRLRWLRRLVAGLAGHDAAEPGKRRSIGGNEFDDTDSS